MGFIRPPGLSETHVPGRTGKHFGPGHSYLLWAPQGSSEQTCPTVSAFFHLNSKCPTHSLFSHFIRSEKETCEYFVLYVKQLLSLVT